MAGLFATFLKKSSTKNFQMEFIKVGVLEWGVQKAKRKSLGQAFSKACREPPTKGRSLSAESEVPYPS